MTYNNGKYKYSVFLIQDGLFSGKRLPAHKESCIITKKDRPIPAISKIVAEGVCYGKQERTVSIIRLFLYGKIFRMESRQYFFS